MAVEFAIVAAPLFFLIFTILEVGLIFLLSSTLERATTDRARTIRIGAAQASGTTTATSFRDGICARLGWLASYCQANLSVDVRTLTNFSDTTAPDPVANGTFNQGALTFDAGEQGEIVLVRAFYRWKLVTPVISGALQRLNGGVTVITATTTFRNEPFGEP